MNGHLKGFRQLLQKLERLTSTMSILQDKQNEWSFNGFSSTGSKVTINTNLCTLQDEQNEWSFYGFSTTRQFNS